MTAEGQPQSGRVIVVSGLPRSGTSLVMQMLEAAGVPLLRDEGRAADADNPRGYFEYGPVKASLRDVSWVEAARGCAVKVVAPLLPCLPAGFDYDVLLLHRDMAEVLASQRIMLERAGAASGGLPDDRVAAVLESQLRDAKAWCRKRARTLEVDHASLLADPGRACETVAAFVGVASAARRMAACVDPALYRQRQR